METSVRYQQDLRDDAWPLRIVQDVYAPVLDTPLRLFSLASARAFWQFSAKQYPGFVQRFAQEQAFWDEVAEISRDPWLGMKRLAQERSLWNDVLPRQEERVWLTEQSYAHPLIQLFREKPLWRWWELFWFIDHLVIQASASQSACYPSNDEAHLHVAFARLDKLDAVLVAGPVWQPVERMTGLDFEHQRIEPLIERFLDCLGSPVKTTDYEAPRLISKGAASYAITADDLVDRLTEARIGLEQLLDTRLPSGSELRRCDHVGLAEWSLFAVQIGRQSLSQPCANLPPPPKVYYRLDHSLQPGQEGAPSWIYTDWLQVPGGDIRPVFLLQYHSPIDGTDETPRIHVAFKSARTDVKPNCESAAVSDNSWRQFLLTRWSRYLSQGLARKHAGKTSSLLMLRESLYDRFGILAMGPAPKSRELDKFYRDLCRKTASLLGADVATLFQYAYSSNRLETKGSFQQGLTDEEERIWAEAMAEAIQNAADDPHVRPRSIVYRCIDNHKTCFTRMYDPLTGDARPEKTDTLLPPLNGLRSARSAIAAPILIHGRPWGVLEVLSFRPFGFRWDNTRFIEGLADILSLFFYYQWLLEHLHGLNQVAVTDKLDLPEKYSQICKNLSEIFLSHGACLWLPGPEGRFFWKGCHNGPDLNPLLDGGRNTISFSADKAPDELLRVFQRNRETPWWRGGIDAPALTGSWFPGSVLGHLKAKGIRRISIIPVRSDTVDRKVAMVFLFDRIEQDHKDDWHHLVGFATRYVALLLEAVHARQDLERQYRNVLVHEIKQQVGVMRGKAFNINGLVRDFLPAMEDRHRLSLYVDDLAAYSRDLEEMLTSLGESDQPLGFASTKKWMRDARNVMQEEVIQSINFRDEVYRAFNGMGKDRRKKGLYFDYDCPPEHQGILLAMHGKNLREVLGNLCNNAVKYADPHSAIQASLVANKYSIDFLLTNKGQCLADGEADRIFRAGFRGSYAIQSGESGHGMGLAIIKAICALYGIELSYESKLQSRTGLCLHCFTLTIPLHLVSGGSGR